MEISPGVYCPGYSYAFMVVNVLGCRLGAEGEGSYNCNMRDG